LSTVAQQTQLSSATSAGEESRVESPRWYVSQLGSRERYACAVSQAKRGRLELFYTDAWCGAFRGLVSKMPRGFAGLSQRFHAELPREKVVAFTAATLCDELKDKFSRRDKSRTAQYERFETSGKWFASKVAAHMSKLPLNAGRDVHFVYDTAALESLKHARERGMFCIVDQIDPARVHEKLLQEEAERWPNWEVREGGIPDSYFARLSEEWATADMVVVNSEYSKRSIHEQGVPLEKIAVVPLAYEAPSGHEIKKHAPSRDKPLRVLWLGTVAVCKGIPYLMEAAKLLRDRNIEFTIVGPIRIAEHAAKSAPSNMKFVGPVLHHNAHRYYQQADLFVLPTISDGFAITQIEAMSHGLPVIATPNCGNVVTPGADGEIVPIRDAASLAKTIAMLEEDRPRLAAMSAKATEKSRQFSLENYAQALDRAVANGRGTAFAKHQQGIAKSRKI